MAYTLELCGADGALRAQVVPCHGGMISQILLRGREVLHLDPGALETAPMAAGGMPFLFPFPSRTREDRYVLDGRAYHMPMHGLFKNAAFAVRSASEREVALWACSNAAMREAHYPFDFEIELRYRIDGDALRLTARVDNRSAAPMPHALGWHPFFKGSDKKRARLKHSMRVHYDYVNCADGPVPALDDLSLRWDDVFHSPAEREVVLENPADGYAVRMRFDEAFQALVVCTWVEDSICVEPWCGIPDSANSGRFLQWIPAGKSAECNVTMQFSPL